MLTTQLSIFPRVQESFLFPLPMSVLGCSSFSYWLCTCRKSALFPYYDLQIFPPPRFLDFIWDDLFSCKNVDFYKVEMTTPFIQALTSTLYLEKPVSL